MTLGTDRSIATASPPESSAAVDSAETAGASRILTVASLVGLVAVMARVVLHAADPLSNGDTWFHLAIGERLLGSWSLGHPGQLSSFGDVPWVPTQWSTEVLAAGFERWFGLPGVAWLFGTLYLALVVGAYAVCRRLGVPLPAAVASGLAILATTPALSARPQIVTLLMLLVVISSWLRAERAQRVPWLLVPLTWVWATAHGMWTVGVVVSAVFCVGLVLDRRVDRRLAVRMFAVPVLCVVAACLTPLGPRLLLSQLTVGRRASLIAEWGPTSFRAFPALVVAAMIGVVVVLWSLQGRVPWTRLLLLLLAAGWAILVARMVACSAVLLAPLLAAALQQMLGLSEVGVATLVRLEARVVGLATVLMLVGLAVAVPRTASEPAQVPAAFGSRLAALPSGAAVAVEDSTGAWLEWRYPGLDPFIDGMLDAYPVGYIERWQDFVRVAPGWQGFLRDSQAGVAVLVAGSPLSDAMQHQLHWTAVQHTGTWVYLVAPAR
ncbi:MAG: hypothetical protein ABI776_09070 [Nocardioidaceae bacterium]